MCWLGEYTDIVQNLPSLSSTCHRAKCASMAAKAQATIFVSLVSLRHSQSHCAYCATSGHCRKYAGIRPMIKLVSVLALLSAALLVACGGVSEDSERADTPAETQVAVTPAQQEASDPEPTSASGASPSPVQQEAAATPSQSGVATDVQSAIPSPEPKFDDDRVEGLVGEWENDLASIARVVECVERTLGLERPLRPVDFELKANQPAIVSCVKAEVGQ